MQLQISLLISDAGHACAFPIARTAAEQPIIIALDAIVSWETLIMHKMWLAFTFPQIAQENVNFVIYRRDSHNVTDVREQNEI